MRKNRFVAYLIRLILVCLLLLSGRALIRSDVSSIPLTCRMIGCPNTNGCIEGGGDINGCIITCHDGTPRFDCEHPYLYQEGF